MSLSRSRRFLNLIVDNRDPGIKSLCRVDLRRHQFFYPDTPPSSANVADGTAASAMERIRLPRPRFTFESTAADGYGWCVRCLPLAGDGKVVCTDQYGHAFLYDADARHVVTMPNLHRHSATSRLLSLFVPGADGGGSLFLMDQVPRPNSTQIWVEALVYRKTNATSPAKSWHCHVLRQPPYADDPAFWKTRPHITSYGVVGGGSHVCVSVENKGTYCLDTASHAWSRVGEWTLPFHGKVEYVPELKLWFGFAAESGHLAAADLSAMDESRQPQLLHSWKEFDPPVNDWKTRRDAQLVNLGSGRLCVARFFFRDVYVRDVYFDVLTGVEVVPRRAQDGDDKNATNNSGTSNGGDSRVQLEMIPHKSKWYSSGYDTIDELF